MVKGIFLSLLFFSGCFDFSKEEQRKEGESQGDCLDGEDNDDDGNIDCEDAGCENKPVCLDEENNDTNDQAIEENFVFGDLIIEPSILDFGEIELGDLKTEELLFINTGTSTLSVVSASLNGDPALSLESSFLNFDIEPEEEEVVMVRFMPNEEKSYETTLSILLSSESDVGEFEIIGTGVDTSGGSSVEPEDAPIERGLSLSKTSHDFGAISLNSTATLIIDVANETEEAIRIIDVTSTNTAFELSPYSNVQVDEIISAGITRTMTINFTPDQENTYNGSFTLTTDSDSTPEITIELSGEGK